jgi:hypothetical protein
MSWTAVAYVDSLDNARPDIKGAYLSLLGRMARFANEDTDEFFAWNATFADHLRCSTRWVTKLVRRAINEGFIVRVGRRPMQGRTRDTWPWLYRFVGHARHDEPRPPEPSSEVEKPEATQVTGPTRDRNQSSRRSYLRGELRFTRNKTLTRNKKSIQSQDEQHTREDRPVAASDIRQARELCNELAEIVVDGDIRGNFKRQWLKPMATLLASRSANEVRAVLALLRRDDWWQARVTGPVDMFNSWDSLTKAAAVQQREDRMRIEQGRAPRGESTNDQVARVLASMEART